MAVGDLLAGMPIMMEDPGVDPQAMPKIEENKSLWKSMFDKVRNDPNIQQALMATGLGMMRSPQVGQSGWDVGANAVAGGMSTLQQNRQLQVQNQLAQRKLGLEETEVGSKVEKNKADIETGRITADTYAATGAQQVESGRKKDAREDTATQLAVGLEPRKVAADEKKAEADLIRANAYTDASKIGRGSTGQNVALVNQRAAALRKLNPGLSEEEATLQAQNDVLFTAKGGGNIASIATQLFKTNLEAWQNSFDNLGKAPTPQDLDRLKTDAMTQAKEFGKLNGQGTPVSATSGKIQRGAPASAPGGDPAIGSEMPGGAPPAAQSLVGKKVAGTGGTFAEIVGEDETTVTLKLPNGRTSVVSKDIAGPHIIAE
jgi:hypothetical protein